MPNASTYRYQIEHALSSRFPAALTPRRRVQPERIACQRTALDKALGGGLALGMLTELAGLAGSGRTTAALAYVKAVTNAGCVCAWIDAADGFDPESAAANGIALEKLLWIRCGATAQATTLALAGAPEPLPGTACPVGLPQPQQRSTGCGSPHPRSEGRDMPEAIHTMLDAQRNLSPQQVRKEKRSIGTPGAPNRPLAYRSEQREEQVNSDRLPPRRGDNLAIAPRCAEPRPHRAASLPTTERTFAQTSPQLGQFKTGATPWKALDQALRATDLLLQGGGFTVIVLDLASVPPETALKIPIATWFRFRAACERTRVSLLLLTQQPCARSSAEAVIRLQPGSLQARGKVMTGVLHQAMTERSRAYEARVIPIRKPPQSEQLRNEAAGHWTSETAWMEAG